MEWNMHLVELGERTANHDWQLLLNTKNATAIAQSQEHIPPCPSGHTTDWCEGFTKEYEYEWDDLASVDAS
jgi:hypothetical protein